MPTRTKTKEPHIATISLNNVISCTNRITASSSQEFHRRFRSSAETVKSHHVPKSLASEIHSSSRDKPALPLFLTSYLFLIPAHNYTATSARRSNFCHNLVLIELFPWDAWRTRVLFFRLTSWQHCARITRSFQFGNKQSFAHLSHIHMVAASFCRKSFSQRISCKIFTEWRSTHHFRKLFLLRRFCFSRHSFQRHSADENTFH